MKKEEYFALTEEKRQEIITEAIEARKLRNSTPDQVRKAERAAEKVAAGERLTVDEFEALTGVMFSHHMTGKMLNILSISSNCLMNPVCLARMKDGESICSECFAAALEGRYSGVFENTAYNTMVLTEKVLPLEVLPVIDADELRIESFGDTANWTQATNYMNMARVNPLVCVTAWTKNPGHYAEAIRRGYSKPGNFKLVYSSPKKNTPGEIPEEYQSIIDKRFTVYTLEWLDEHGFGPEFINCGGRSCKGCERCYLNADRTDFDVRELLKEDADRAARTRGGAWSVWGDDIIEELPKTVQQAARDILALFGK